MTMGRSPTRTGLALTGWAVLTLGMVIGLTRSVSAAAEQGPMLDEPE
jgi:hypothetical protein